METFKACQDTDITTKNTKESAGIFADILLASFNDSVKKKKKLSIFPKKANIMPVF